MRFHFQTLIPAGISSSAKSFHGESDETYFDHRGKRIDRDRIAGSLSKR
ncbi:hypothetical protein RE6C_06029 [Rhodopirellula europaea 6C]|uniref:Uncharacterized protein n=1 Tax=Rhodopirellula europaea 6C TaxID=1263867 RepID=M2ATH4_9BACT|nr:hypothetical protein RE6C_06029 [Rhodopirellula europaea 6C]